jgi:hypothetical protein
VSVVPPTLDPNGPTVERNETTTRSEYREEKERNFYANQDSSPAWWVWAKDRSDHLVIAIVALAVGFLLGWFINNLYHGGHLLYRVRPSIIQLKPPAPVTTNNPVNDHVQRPSDDASSSQIAIATVRKGEGIERPLIRQLMASPDLYGFKGDASNNAAVKTWAEKKAHVIAIKAGYVDRKFGGEIRVKHPGEVAYVLENDDHGGLRVAEYANHGNTTEKVRTLVASSPGNQFLGWPGQEHIQPYEYLYTAG